MAASEKKTRILCIEDDAQMRTFLTAQLKARGFQTQAVRDGAQAIDVAAIFQPQLVLLDLSLPSLDGLTFLRRLREWSKAPVIVLSAHDEEPIKIKALDMGADDYLTKPFSLNELLARIRVALRRSEETDRLRNNAVAEQQRPGYSYGGQNGLRVNFARRQVIANGQEVHLTPTEYDLLCELTRHPGKVLTHRELLQRVWGSDYSGENTYLRTFIRHLRRKLEPDPANPRFLHNELGVGYYVPAPDTESDLETEAQGTPSQP
ncbi:response regulator [Ktedonobacter racemifer]|uniref:Two component transcriptional regulator, winged helix family n=1 Tax=Ktedonobacter racemifer DSM 44963 TaxID=485913 RepID=D6TFI9_KTERA|nr:response regulator transcription factor [Ktedonobacter racemifer]EFH88669.1 two component transcriptional regulator, winged helix family [Ktedonobacter racemifer DSM 44963]